MQTEYRNIYSMGTRLDLVFPGLDGKRCDAVMKQVKGELMRLEGKLSNYLADSEISMINRTAHAGQVWIDEELRSLLLEVLDLHRESSGFFDVTLRPVFDYRRENPGEGAEMPDGISNLIGMDKLQIEEGGIRLTQKGVRIDTGGFGKGYAMRRMQFILDSSGIESALISFGESLVYGRGNHPYGDCWKVCVPCEACDPIEFELNNESLSTSGNSLNNQKKFANSGHIVNPVTLKTQKAEGLVSVKSRDPLRAEVYSTALFSAGKERSAEILERLPDLEVRWSNM